MRTLKLYPVAMVLVFSIMFYSLFGCQAMKNAGVDSKSYASYAAYFATSARWVLAVTDGIIPTMCSTQSLDTKVCLAYSFSASALKMALDRVDKALASYQSSGTAMTQVELRDAVAEATSTYQKVDAAYKGKWDEVVK